MIFELPYRRLLVLTEGHLDTHASKTAWSVLRYRRADVVGVLDSAHAGRPIESLAGDVSGVPIFASVAE